MKILMMTGKRHMRRILYISKTDKISSFKEIFEKCTQGYYVEEYKYLGDINELRQYNRANGFDLVVGCFESADIVLRIYETPKLVIDPIIAGDIWNNDNWDSEERLSTLALVCETDKVKEMDGHIKWIYSFPKEYLDSEDDLMKHVVVPYVSKWFDEIAPQVNDYFSAGVQV